MIARLLCAVGYHRFPGWGERARGIGDQPALGAVHTLREGVVRADISAALRMLVDDGDLLWTVARRAVEDELVDWRDNRRSQPFRNNGFVIKEKDSTPSDVIRFGPEVGVRIALRALADHLGAAS